MTRDALTVDEVKGLVRLALSDLYAEPSPIMRANERAIVARFAIHLARAVEPRASDLHVDVEYSRVEELGEVKALPGGGQIYPDVIVHHRGSQIANLLVIEFKLSAAIPLRERGCPDQTDWKKVTTLVTHGPEVRGSRPYTVGLCATLYADRAELWWAKSGDVVATEPEVVRAESHDR